MTIPVVTPPSIFAPPPPPLPTLQFPLGWLLDHASAPIRYRSLIDVAKMGSQLPPQEKQEIKIEVDRLIDAFREGRLSGEQVGLIFEKLGESPLLTMIMVSTVDRHYFENSGLNDEEKAEGRVTLQRFLRGAIDGTIDEDSVDTAMAHVADRQPGGGWELQQAAMTGDIPVVQSLFVAIALSVVVVNLLVDVAQVMLDPRLRQ